MTNNDKVRELADNAADLLAAKIRLEAECERLKTLGSDYDLEELLRIYTALHDGKVTAHWLWVAIERIGAGESVTECLEDYGYIPEQRADKAEATIKQARDIADGMSCAEWCCTSVTKGIPDQCDVCKLQQALNAPETA